MYTLRFSPFCVTFSQTTFTGDFLQSENWSNFIWLDLVSPGIDSDDGGRLTFGGRGLQGEKVQQMGPGGSEQRVFQEWDPQNRHCFEYV